MCTPVSYINCNAAPKELQLSSLGYFPSLRDCPTGDTNMPSRHLHYSPSHPHLSLSPLIWHHLNSTISVTGQQQHPWLCRPLTCLTVRLQCLVRRVTVYWVLTHHQDLVLSLSSFIDTMVVGTPSLQYPTLESLASGSPEALVEAQLATSSRDSSSESISSSLLRAAQAYLEALDNELHFHHLVGALSPLTSPNPLLDIVLEQPAHTTGTTTNTGLASMPAPSFLRHLPNWFIDNPVNVALRVEGWRQDVPREWYHHLRHMNQVGQERKLHWAWEDRCRNEMPYLRPQERISYKY